MIISGERTVTCGKFVLKTLALDPDMRLGPHNHLVVYCLLLASIYYQLLTRFQVGPSFDGPAELVFME